MTRFVMTGLVATSALALTIAACSRPAEEAAAPSSPHLDYQVVGTIKDIMEDIVDPASDILFDAVATDITAAGINEKRPQNDAEWKVVEASAMAIAEAANLLKMPGRKVAEDHESTQSDIENAPELTTAEIAAKIDADRARFARYASELQQTGIKTLDAARKKDPDELFALGEELDTRCENCHIEYWYPNDPAYQTRRKELEAIK